MQDAKRLKKYRIMSIEAEKLVHTKSKNGFSSKVDGKRNLKLFSGILDYSLESEKLYEVFQGKKTLPRKMYFSEGDYNYTTAIINVKFNFAKHDFVKINDIFVRGDYRVGEGFSNCSEVRADEEGKQTLIAIKLNQRLDAPPLSHDLLGDYFAYDAKENWYVRRRGENGKPVAFATVKKITELREKLYKEGFDCDGVHYMRYKRSAGSSRTGQCLFIAAPLLSDMKSWSFCGLDLEVQKEMDIASFEAYVSLSLSSISDKIRIPKESILFMKDVQSSFETRAASVENLREDNGSQKKKNARAKKHHKDDVCSQTKNVCVKNLIWDGEALLDSQVFADAGYGNRGMMLLRNHFFKTCAFNTNLRQYFADHGITSPTQLRGYTLAKNIADIKMIVTESSLKYLKLTDPSKASGPSDDINLTDDEKDEIWRKRICTWLGYIDDTFGIVKTDKPTGFFGGQVVRTSYQLLNTLGLSRAESEELLQETFDYYKNVRTMPIYMRNYINYTLSEAENENDGREDRVGYYNARQQAILRCLSENDSFFGTAMCKSFRSDVLSSFSKKIRSGKLLIKGTNATIFGNGLELLAASIGQYKEGDDAIALGGEGKIYCKRFEAGTELLGCRSPHVTMGNLMVAENLRVPEIDRYFNLTNEIVYVNAIGCNIQQRLNGCDYDSDAMLLTDNTLMVRAAKRCAHFPVPVCSIDSEAKKDSGYLHKKIANVDHDISQNKIGEIINLSQLLNTLYWHRVVNNPEMTAENEELYSDICILAVLSGMEIDKAKRNYNVDTSLTLKNIKEKYPIERLPEFFKFIMYTLESKKFNGETFSYDTTMDYVFSATRSYISKISVKKEERLPLSYFVDQFKKNGGRIEGNGNDAHNCNSIKKAVLESCSRIGELRIRLHTADGDEKFQVYEKIEQCYNETVGYVSEHLKNRHMLKRLLDDIDEWFTPDKNTASEEQGETNRSENEKFYWILFEVLCLENNHLFYKLLDETRDTDMYDLVPDESGSVLIYGVNHSEKLFKESSKKREK